MTTTELDRRLHASVLKREAWKEQEFREKKAKHEEELQLGFGATEMSKAELRKVIDSDRRMYYRSEELNDKLFIHYKGWKQIANLEGWTGLKALYAECNAFDRIAGLSSCVQLRSLFLQENCIKKIEGLENCKQLWNLNLNNNFIERIEGLDQCPRLNTLTMQKNKLGHNGVEDLVHLVDTTISTLDVQGNKISDPDVLPEVFMQMQDLRVLYLKDNPCAKKLPNYRKTLTANCVNLKYLDDRPVFVEDRRTADAFNRGGLEEERAERRRIKEEERNAHDRNMKAFQEMVERAKAEKRERLAMRVEDKYRDETDPVVDRETRLRQQVEQWKEDHAEELKDHDRERAERMLKEERERGEEKQNRSNEDELASEPDVDEPGEGEEDVSCRFSKHEGSEAPKEEAEEEQKEKKVDNRKLVYEDIWGDEPGAQGGSMSSTAAPKSFQPPPRQTASSQNMGNGEAFLPWAAGAAGLDGVAASESAVDRRVAALKEKGGSFNPPPRTAPKSSDAESAAAGKSSWHSKYLEKVQQKEAELQLGIEKAKAKPGAAVPEAPPSGTADEGAELDEMD
mmetsp:Transcript_89664/g.159259  ORF Transcript_89664/g.159259 Transcript_89664/m.159259 type:complete len:567 (-) Transcript_89664:97-1797(-)|eukprot:CAMPEP_0197649008 /NCGR_PEP_ID=MMETSP1338-20131121/28094_1 /TAXON_ID=43686 ORGANISM="Pelagodinium beii, Strain RCC1491" /NCGR_SAMPLE_ID=MMETSP1338 /ASSEMBLY_ACC=CAM_ASM_000754 /LENGTH=566 /DNA_ID=CAMNT_0043223103 /DNA_START=88 /DNA_END=1788 /DNA_ORIENTATION=+